MSEQEGLDIGRVVGLIMENPQLIEQISALAKSDEGKNEPATPEVSAQKSEPVTNEIKGIPYTSSSHKNDRAKLLGALKPYISKERAKAIDSMLTIADILDMMRTR